jgi:hypothetical protein
VLLALQAPTTGAPRSSLLATTTDPLLPPKTVTERLAHFPDNLYDTRPGTHLVRLMSALLGDAGAGGIRKRYVAARLQSVVATMRYLDLDAFYGALFGLRRLSRETLDLNPYIDSATPDEWAEIDARDASYRSRLAAFSRSIPFAGTPEGMIATAEAMLGTECRIYESWVLVDETGSNPGGAPPTPGARLYSDVEEDFDSYGDMDRGTYADVEAGTGGFGRTTSTNRGEFVIRPMRQITLEELRQLTQVLTRLKPAGALLTVDPLGVEIHSPVQVRDVAADSEDWEVSAKVAASTSVAGYYPHPSSTPVAQPRPVHAGYQGEAWSYNSDVAGTRSYVLSATGATVSEVDYERVLDGAGRPVDLSPDQALSNPASILLGRAASDGIMMVAAYAPERGRAL